MMDWGIEKLDTGFFRFNLLHPEDDSLDINWFIDNQTALNIRNALNQLVIE